MLCKSCNDLEDGRSKEAEQHPEQARGPSSSRVLVHHATWASFEDAVGAGCHLCTSIHEELVAERLIPESQPDTARLYVQAHAPTSMPSGTLEFSPSM